LQQKNLIILKIIINFPLFVKISDKLIWNFFVAHL